MRLVIGANQEEAVRWERWKEEKPGTKHLITALSESRTLIKKELARVKAERQTAGPSGPPRPTAVQPGVTTGFNPIR